MTSGQRTVPPSSLQLFGLATNGCPFASTPFLLATFFFGKSGNGLYDRRTPSLAGRQHPALVLKIRIERQFHQIALLQFAVEYEARAASDMIGFERHPPDQVVIVGQERFEVFC